MGNFVRTVTEKVRRFAGKTERYQEAVTFAEADDQDHARALFKEEPAIEESPARLLLVVGKESAFSESIMSYALEMAERMSYEILALNTAPLSCETFKLFSSSRSKVCSEFQDLSEKNVHQFRTRAEEMGIPFSHVVKFTEQDEAVEELQREHKNVEFVVSEATQNQATDGVQDSNRPSRGVYVYSMAQH